MVKLGDIHSEKDAVNFILDKVWEPYITNYMNRVSRHSNARKTPHYVVPDLRAWNFPTGKQRVNDSDTTMTAEAFFGVKTYTLRRSRYNNNNNDTTKPSDRWAKEIVISYSQKFKKLDSIFAADIVGDGSNNVVGRPFEAAQSQFHNKKVVPICVGWFGEINRDLTNSFNASHERRRLPMTERQYRHLSISIGKQGLSRLCFNNLDGLESE